MWVVEEESTILGVFKQRDGGDWLIRLVDLHSGNEKSRLKIGFDLRLVRRLEGLLFIGVGK
jgi:hypothetical protein